jgi:hypothetical protein
MERFLDLFQYRFGIGFRYLGPLAALVNWVPAIMLAIPWKSGFEFGFDAIPISIAHYVLPQFLMGGTDYSSPAA